MNNDHQHNNNNDHTETNGFDNDYHRQTPPAPTQIDDEINDEQELPNSVHHREIASPEIQV
jgi:hypothetical protein